MSHMLSLLLLQSLSFYQSVLSQTNLCIWGRLDYNAIMNGLYTQQQNPYNNKMTYRKPAGTGCDSFYIYWENDSWLIGTTLGNNYYHAYCNSSHTLTNCNEWNVWNGDYFELDTQVTISTGQCPTLNCDAITIPNAPNDCDSFDISLGNNVWKNSANTRWWYFDPQYFSWHCNDYDPTPTYSCDDVYWTWSEEGWTDLTKGESTPITLLYPTTDTYTLNCISNTPSTTTTDFPTEIPTVVPTEQPTTQFPTEIPTDIPTNVPTVTPTNIPSDSPLNSPTIIPTNSPHQNPTVTPTTIPTVHIQSTLNPSTSTLAVSHKGDKDEGYVGDSYTTAVLSEYVDNVQGYTNDNSSFWSVIIVFLVFTLLCISSLIIIFVYKHKKQKAMGEIKKTAAYAINKQISNVPRMMPRDRVQTHSHYIDDDAKQCVSSNQVDGGGTNTHVDISEDAPKIIYDDATPCDERNSAELDKHLEMHDNYSELMETPGNISNVPSEEIDIVYNNQVTLGIDDNTQGMEAEGQETNITVKDWLETDVKLPQYYDVFIQNGYDTLEIIKAITCKSELEEIGINLKGHVLKVFTEIKKLQNLD